MNQAAGIHGTMKLFHVSEEPGIERFAPRHHPHQLDLGPAVWAVDDEHLRNYLLPRDCPRVTFYALESSADKDVDRYLDGSRNNKVVAVEEAWLSRINTTRLYLYEMDPRDFHVHDEGAGHFRARVPVSPMDVQPVQDLVNEIKGRQAEFRPLSTLWPLFDLIVPSTLQFSMIRMRNASPRQRETNKDPL